jgi:polyferredoxin/ferredoxin
MRIIMVRRICQVFFLVLFVWFCVVMTLGEKWWQLRGWPVNWLMQLDPLVGLATLLATGTLYAGLLWGLVTIVLTIFLGRFFCGWVCPFGSIHHFVGFWGRRRQAVKAQLDANAYRRGQSLKYGLLIFLLSAAIGELLSSLVSWPWHQTSNAVIGGIVVMLGGLLAVAWKQVARLRNAIVMGVSLGLLGLALGLVFKGEKFLVTSLQTGLLDPLPLLYRSINLALLPLIQRGSLQLATAPRAYDGAWLIGAFFGAALFLNLWIPRFYCRFVCPLGALLGCLGRWAIWRIGKNESACHDCRLCEQHCEGACQPATRIRISECVLCLNCREDCRHGYVDYRTRPSATGEIVNPDITKREFLTAFVAGSAMASLMRLSGTTASNWNPGLVRPPGSLTETAFLARCTKCGQCMRICPTNVIQPDGLTGGPESLWTPVLNFRIGSSGCQINCIACGHVCPTAAIRPLSLDERLGREQFAAAGPIRIGTAFVDRGRCLPWAMDRPCIVCQENCPVSPKAIFTRTQFNPIGTLEPLIVKEIKDHTVQVTSVALRSGQFATGDYYCRIDDQAGMTRHRIAENSEDSIGLVPSDGWRTRLRKGQTLVIEIQLQQPWVDPQRCVGCGVCEHECPIKGLRAIRVTAENETRSHEHGMLLPP